VHARGVCVRNTSGHLTSNRTMQFKKVRIWKSLQDTNVVLVENVVKDLVVDDLNVQGLEDEVDNGEESDSSTALGGTDLGGGGIDGGAGDLDVVAI